MGEVITAAIIFLILIVAMVGGLLWLRSSTTQRKSLLRAPAILIPEGESPDVLLANAVKNYQLAQRAVRLLDRLSEQPDTATISDRNRKEAKAIVSDFYSN